MKHLLLAAIAAASLILPAIASEPAPIPSPGEIAEAAPASDWIAIAPSDLFVMDLAPDAKGEPRRVVIQLMPAPTGAIPSLSGPPVAPTSVTFQYRCER